MRIDTISDEHTLFQKRYALGSTRSDPSPIRIPTTSIDLSTSTEWMMSSYPSTRPFVVRLSQLVAREDPSGQLPYLCFLEVDRPSTSTTRIRLILSRLSFLKVATSSCSRDAVPQGTPCPARISHSLTSCFFLTTRGSHTQCFGR